jgi:hypothetical protein
MTKAIVDETAKCLFPVSRSCRTQLVEEQPLQMGTRHSDKRQISAFFAEAF